MKTTKKSATTKLNAAQKAWITRRKAATKSAKNKGSAKKGATSKTSNLKSKSLKGNQKKKAASKPLNAAQKAWITIRSRQAAALVKVKAALKPVAAAVKKVAAPKKTVKGLIKEVPFVTTAELKGQFNTPAKPTTVKALLNSANKWVKGSSALTSSGAYTYAGASNAVKFCLSGAIEHIYGVTKLNDILAKLNGVIEKYSLGKQTDAVSFNDAHGTQFVDIQRVVALAGI